MTGRFTLAFLVIACLVPGPLSAAGLPADALDALGHRAWEIREIAMQRLLGDPNVDPAAVAEAWPRARTPEQRQRLLTIGRHAVLRRIAEEAYPDGGAGAVGVITIEAEAGRSGVAADGVEVLETFAGFPAFATLRTGDLIVAVGEESLDGPDPGDRFRRLVKRHPPGDGLTLTVLRADRRLEVAFRLASLPALQDLYSSRPDGSVTLAAFAERRWRAWREELDPAPDPPRFPDPRPLPGPPSALPADPDR